MLNLVLINDWGLHMGLFCSCEVQQMGRDRMILALTVAECCSYFWLFEIWCRLILNLVLIVMPGLIARLHLAASAPMLCWVCPLFFFFFFFQIAYGIYLMLFNPHAISLIHTII